MESPGVVLSPVLCQPVPIKLALTQNVSRSCDFVCAGEVPTSTQDLPLPLLLPIDAPSQPIDTRRLMTVTLRPLNGRSITRGRRAVMGGPLGFLCLAVRGILIQEGVFGHLL